MKWHKSQVKRLLIVGWADAFFYGLLIRFLISWEVLLCLQ